MRVRQRVVEMERVDDVRIVDDDEVQLAVVSPFLADGVDALDDDDVAPVDLADRRRQPRRQGLPLRARRRHARLIQDVVAGDDGLVRVALRDRAPQRSQPVLVGCVPSHRPFPSAFD